MESSSAILDTGTESEYLLPLPRPYDSTARPPPPNGTNIDGRPVSEPPVFSYDHLIGEEYEKKREAVMKLTNRDPVLTTAFMDVHTEWRLLYDYLTWLDINIGEASGHEARDFFVGLREEVHRDRIEITGQVLKFKMRVDRKSDGTYVAEAREWDFLAFDSEASYYSSKDEESNSPKPEDDIQSINEPRAQSPSADDNEGGERDREWKAVSSSSAENENIPGPPTPPAPEQAEEEGHSAPIIDLLTLWW